MYWWETPIENKSTMPDRPPTYENLECHTAICIPKTWTAEDNQIQSYTSSQRANPPSVWFDYHWFTPVDPGPGMWQALITSNWTDDLRVPTVCQCHAGCCMFITFHFQTKVNVIASISHFRNCSSGREMPTDPNQDWNLVLSILQAVHPICFESPLEKRLEAFPPWLQTMASSPVTPEGHS